MACGARSGLKLSTRQLGKGIDSRLNGLWSPFGIETHRADHRAFFHSRLNGLWSPFGIETNTVFLLVKLFFWLNGLWSPFGIETFGFPLQWHLGEERWREAHQGGQKKTAAMSDEREGWPRPVPERRRSELPSRPAAGCRYGCGWSDERARRPWASARPRDGR